MQQREIGAFTFPSKKAAEREIRRILHNSPLDTPLTGNDAELITALLGLHHEAEEKIGPGVDHIEVRIIEYGSRGFWITRTDGSVRDFSYRTALNGAASHPAQVKRAMRAAIREQVDEFRRRAFSDGGGSVTCPLTDEVMEIGPWAHVDHIVEFSIIADVYAENVGGYQQIAVASSMTHPGPALLEPDLTQWATFHKHVAKLRIIHQSANLARYKGDAA